MSSASLYTLLTAFTFVIGAKAQTGPASITMMGVDCPLTNSSGCFYGVQVCSSSGVFWGGSFPTPPFAPPAAASCWDSSSSNPPGNPFYTSFYYYAGTNQFFAVPPAVPAVGVRFVAGLYCSSYCSCNENCSGAVYASCG